VTVDALGHTDLGRVEAVVGSRAFARGRTYARHGRVLRFWWDDEHDALVASVLGRGDVYETRAYFDTDGAGSLEMIEGECTCPVGYDCKHVAAIVVAAADAATSTGSAGRTTATWQRARTERTTRAARSVQDERSAASRARAGRSLAAPPPAHRAPNPTPPGWHESLTALIGGGGPAADAADEVPLAIELTVGVPRSSRPRDRDTWLTARIMRAGRKGWVNDNLSWGDLSSWRIGHGHFVAEQVRVLRAVYALYQAGNDRPSYSWSYAADRSIDFAAFGHPLWALLDEAARAGLRIVHANGALRDVERDRRAELCLDVTRSDGTDLVVTPSLRVEREGAEPGTDGELGCGPELVTVGFLGASGHGVVYTSRDDVTANPDPASWRLGLAQLATPATAALRQMVRDERRVKIPAAEHATFAEDLWPRLRHVAKVTSSDGAFVPPRISGPRLVLRLGYGAGHAVDVDWEWAYQVGTSDRRAGIGADPAEASYRDPDAEHALAATVDPGLERFGLLTPAGLASTRLAGLDTMRFTTEELPLLADDPEVIVEVTGQPANFREVTDSLEIGLTTEVVTGDTDWFDLGVTITVDGRDLPFTDVFLALAAGETHLLLADGAYFSLEKPELQALRGLIEEARALQDHEGEALRISRYQAGLWDELCQLGVVRHQAEAWERQVGALLTVDPTDVADVPVAVTAELRPYQREGYGWLTFLRQHGLGGILADDMGLGKTLQTLAMICNAREQDPTLAPFLIVAPTSVVANWVAEAARFAPTLSVVPVTDTLRKSGRTADEIADGAHLVVTTYTLFRLDADAYATVDWAGLVLDEAQHVKNHRSKTYGHVRRLPAPFKLAITGTPMENNLMELWSLLSITAPGLFPNPARFAEHYASPIERRGDVELLAQLRRRIKPLMKRRTKEHVAPDLPAKQEQVLDVDLHPRHRRIYQTHLQRERQKILGLIGDFDRNRFTILRSITLLRQLSLHPALVDEDAAGVPCAKLDTLVEQMREVVDGGHRALVFSQFTGFLGLVRERLDREGLDHCYLDGHTRKRDDMVRRFKNGAAPVFLISLKAGGFGLNLTEADYCFLLDPWWNPATEAQAVDRTHRIGQTRNVMAYRLVSRDTIEEKVMALKQRKAELVGGVIDDGDLFGGRLAAEDIHALLG
jgi:superfamily II DNA or RNA helicase